MLFSNDFLFLLPESFFAFSIVALLLFSVSLSNKLRLVLIYHVKYLMLFSLIVLAGLYISLPASEYILLNYQYSVDTFVTISRYVLLFFFSICLFLSADYFFVERVFFVEYFFLVGLFCLSAFALMASGDFLIFYFAVELQALVLYTLAALKRYTVFSAESGLKYFVLGALSSGLLLFGISLFYGFLGLLSFSDLKFLFLSWLDLDLYAGVLVSVLFILAGLLFKLSAAPFHIWAPDVYDGAPTPVVLFFAILPKFAMFVFVAKLSLSLLNELTAVWNDVLFLSGLLSVLWGTLAALNQFNIKRLYIYSAIVNVGYLLTTLSYGTYDSLLVLFNYLMIYFISTLSIFLVIMLFRKAVNLQKIKFLLEYRLYSTYSTPFAVLYALVFFSLAGVPPLAGFFAKFFLFKVVFAGSFLSNPAFFFILILSVVSAFYYIRCVQFIFFDTLRRPSLFSPLPFAAVFLFVTSIFLLVVFTLFQPAMYLASALLLGKLFF